jgi:imidazolonepropionase-like amidohydrolase
MRDEGVMLLIGTDAGGTVGHGSLPAEAEELVVAGISAAEVVAASTWRARDFLGVPGIAEGASADVVVLDADPREDITTLARPRDVVLRGTRVAP